MFFHERGEEVCRAGVVVAFGAGLTIGAQLHDEFFMKREKLGDHVISGQADAGVRG